MACCCSLEDLDLYRSLERPISVALGLEVAGYLLVTKSSTNSLLLLCLVQDFADFVKYILEPSDWESLFMQAMPEVLAY